VRSLPEAVYAAERVVDETTRRFATMAEVKEFVEHVVDDDWFYDTYPAARGRYPIVESRSSSASFSVCAGDVIAIGNSPHHRTAAVVLHELAHFATASADGHGPIFRNAYLKLVRRHMGFYAWADLEQAYRHEIIV